VAIEELEKILTKDPPYNATVTFTKVGDGSGWNCPQYEDWLLKALDEAAQAYFGKPVLSQSEGGSIPLMGQL
jgi:hypothetical protein